MNYYSKTVNLVLRKIKKSKWYTNTGVSWLEPNDLQADALSDLRTTNNTLSFWQINSDRSNLDRVLTALAASNNVLSNIDYALFDEQVLIRLNIQYIRTPGDSPDEEMNIKFHIDAQQLTAIKLFKLAKTIQREAAKERCSEKQALTLLRSGVTQGSISHLKLHPKLSEKIAQ